MNPRASPRQVSYNIDWKQYKQWLCDRYVPKTVIDKFGYARKYSQCLLNRDFHDLHSLSDDKRIHVMKALSTLSKYLGEHQTFKELVKNYGLKWSSQNRDDLIIARLTKVVNGNEIIEWIQKVKSISPDYALFMDFMVVTGLRYCEAVKSTNLVIQLSKENKLNKYYNERKEILEHYQFKDIFIRRTKKAFISFIPKDFIGQITKSKPLTLSILPNRLKRKGMKQRFSDIREYHASILLKQLKQPEIDFIHGRVSTNIFMRNYFNPAWINDLKNRVFDSVKELLKLIEGIDRILS